MSYNVILPKIKLIDSQLIDHCGGTVLTLNPKSNSARLLEEIFDTIDLGESEYIDIILETLSTIQLEQCFNFPNNIFWDKDYFVSYFIETIYTIEDNKREEYILQFKELNTNLLQLFGKNSTIQFQYLHDFTYGFDWAKWVSKDSKVRKKILPFSHQFLTRMYKRGNELQKLISDNDKKYPSISTNEFRNPFHFNRSTKNEIKLLSELALIDGIPLKGWEPELTLEWNKDFSELRESIANTLGIKTN